MFPTGSDLKTSKQLTNFYNKIRLDLSEIQPKTDDQDDVYNGIAEENLYGKITKQEFETILQSYDNQQQSNELRDEPVTCDKVAGDCYAKLLFSKKGFHQLGSAKYLSSDLGIKDANRASFLAGFNKYEIDKNEDIKGLRKYHLKLAVKAHLDKAIEYLEKEEPQLNEAKRELGEAARLDSKSADAAVVRGRYNSMTHNYEIAIQDYKEALQGELTDHDCGHIKIRLSEALADHGLFLYHRAEFRKAETIFTEAVEHNPNNQNALFHRSLCQDKIRSGNIFSSSHKYRK